jgi:hypothetical protein
LNDCNIDVFATRIVHDHGIGTLVVSVVVAPLEPYGDGVFVVPLPRVDKRVSDVKQVSITDNLCFELSLGVVIHPGALERPRRVLWASVQHDFACFRHRHRVRDERELRIRIWIEGYLDALIWHWRILAMGRGTRECADGHCVGMTKNACGGAAMFAAPPHTFSFTGLELSTARIIHDHGVGARNLLAI